MAEEDVDVTQLLDLSKKKKKKKKSKKKEESGGGSSGGGTGGGEDGGGGGAAGTTGSDDVGGTLSPEVIAMQQKLLLQQDSDQEINDDEDNHAGSSYETLLDRIVDLIVTNNPELADKKPTRIKPPQLQMIGSRKTLWVNFQEICTMMQRDPQHVYSFLMAELGTEGSIDGNERLIIRGRYLPKYIESLLRKYVVEYVTCEMCRSPNTVLQRDQGSRLYFCSCKDCGSQRSVATVRTGYHATSRADRRAARNARG